MEKQKTINTENQPIQKRTPSDEKPNNRKKMLRIQKTNYTGEKPFRCKTCDKCFTRIGQLTVHERSHTGGKPYQCKICGKCFSEIGHLKIHERLHTGEKPYPCKTCDKCFSEIGHLKVHERLHTGEKLYQCKTCNKCFTVKASLQRHERLHTGEKPYECRICGKVFTERGNLKRHERSLIVHKISHSVKMPSECSTLLFSEDKELNDNDISILDKSSSLDFGHAGKFTCWICQEELSSASLLLEHYDDHMK